MNALLELARLLKPSLVFDWFHRALADLLVRCAGGDPDVPNLLISSPPGSGKTELVSILFPAYIFARDQSAHVITLANSDSLATMASSNVLRLVQHPGFQERWPLTLDKAAAAQWTILGNDGRPSMHAAGITGQLTGQRADYLIFDDLIKSQRPIPKLCESAPGPTFLAPRKLDCCPRAKLCRPVAAPRPGGSARPPIPLRELGRVE